MKVTISIIVPVYNVEKYLSQCIDSILAQSYSNWELILIDDGSHDSSGSICDAYAQKDLRIKVVHKQNAGVGAARNTGLDIATGEFVAFVDSDDFCSPSYIENFFVEGKTDKDLVIQGYEEYTESARPGVKFSNKLYLCSDIVAAILDNNLLTFGAPYCKLFRRSIIEHNKIRFSTKYSFGEDTYFFFDYISHIYSMQMAEGVGYFYRCEQNGSLSMKNHDFDNLAAFAVDSLALLRRVDKGCRLEEAYSFTYCGLYSRALANMYRMKYSLQKRLNCIASLKSSPEVKLGRKSHIYKFTYVFARKCPSLIVDLFLYFNYLIKH